MTPGPVAVSLNGRFVVGSTAVAADAPLASDNDTPINPSAGTTSFRVLRVDACFDFDILGILPSPFGRTSTSWSAPGFAPVENYRIALKRALVYGVIELGERGPNRCCRLRAPKPTLGCPSRTMAEPPRPWLSANFDCMRSLRWEAAQIGSPRKIRCGCPLFDAPPRRVWKRSL